MSALPVGTLLKVLPPRNNQGKIVRDDFAITGQYARVVKPGRMRDPNTEDHLNVEIISTGTYFYLPTDRVTRVREQSEIAPIVRKAS